MLMTHEVASWGCFRQAQIFVGCENALTRLGQLEALACNHHGPLLPPRPCHYDMVHNAYVQVPWLQCLKALYKLAGLGAVLTPGARLEALPPRRSLLCAEPLCVPARPSCHRATSLSVGLLLQRSCFACSGCADAFSYLTPCRERYGSCPKSCITLNLPAAPRLPLILILH